MLLGVSSLSPGTCRSRAPGRARTALVESTTKREGPVRATSAERDCVSRAMMCPKLLGLLSARVASVGFPLSVGSWPNSGLVRVLGRWCWGPRRLAGWALRPPLAPRPKETRTDIHVSRVRTRRTSWLNSKVYCTVVPAGALLPALFRRWPNLV